MNDIHANAILIIDFGSQYAQLIARRVREIGVYCEIHPYDVEPAVIEKLNPQGIILSGGPETVTDPTTARIPPIIFTLNRPILGICYGMQVMAAQLGGKVATAQKREFGYAKVVNHGASPLLAGIEDEINDQGQPILAVWMSHGDKVDELPPGFVTLGSSNNAPHAVMAHEKHPWYGVQFHPEVTHTPQGTRILQRFIHDICHSEALWTSQSIVEESIHDLRTKVGNDKVILGLSGGVDSSVVAALLHKAIGDQLTCIFVDTGLLRAGEAEQVMQTFKKYGGMRVIIANAQQQFLTALKGVTDPEQKRKIIGSEFVKVFEAEAGKLTGVKWLAQGTIYPDVIESAATKTGKGQVIKSHHNVGGLPETLSLKLLEPLRELFKDEVRAIGLNLGLPQTMINRHPFPGPGLGVRILGEVTQQAIDLLRQADAIFIEELHQWHLYDTVSQAFAVFLPVKSVGVMGDARCYDFVIALRAVKTSDFMTAHWAHLPYEFLSEVSQRIINEINGISRVTYDISGKPPATIEWE